MGYSHRNLYFKLLQCDGSYCIPIISYCLVILSQCSAARLRHFRNAFLSVSFLLSFLPAQERYKADISLAIQLLQCKPDSFVSQKVSSVGILRRGV